MPTLKMPSSFWWKCVDSHRTKLDNKCQNSSRGKDDNFDHCHPGQNYLLHFWTTRQTKRLISNELFSTLDQTFNNRFCIVINGSFFVMRVPNLDHYLLTLGQFHVSLKKVSGFPIIRDEITTDWLLIVEIPGVISIR